MKKDINRMYKIIHNFQYEPTDSVQEKRAKVDQKLDMIIKSGYSGIVTNVGFDKYLENDSEWEMLDYIVEKCEQNGLKIWFYDEKGWPSGSAGGLTLKTHPEYETKGVVAIVKSVKAKESVKIEFPYNHLKVLYAVAYDGNSLDDFVFESAENLTDTLDQNNDLVYKNQTDKNKIVCTFILRQFYEGTTQSCGLFAARRSIDVSDDRAVKEFIRNTYEKYNSRYSGKFQAYFTDEPGYPGFYYVVKRDNQKIDDMPDWNTPLLPPVNWGNDFEIKFKNIKGYDLIPYLPYLFGNIGEKAQEVRFDFYEVLSELYEKAFFKQLADYCGKNDLIFSGHIQSEDNMKQHVLYEGDLFRQMRHMQVPGIDMLTSLPEKILNAPDEHFPPLGGAQEIINWATGPKTVSSIARLNGKKDVMSEVSAHQESGNVANEKRLGAILLQYALGVTVFTSYHRDYVEELFEVNRVLNNVYKNATDLRANMQVGLYYPLQQMWYHVIPAGVEEFTPSKSKIDNVLDVTQYSFSKCNRELIINQLDCEIIGYDFLASATIKDGKYYLSGGEYQVLVIPTCTIDQKLKEQILRFSSLGVKVVIVTHTLMEQDLSFVDGKDNIIVLSNEQDISSEVRKLIKEPFVIVKNGNSEFVCQVKGMADDKLKEYVFVNFTDKKYQSTVSLSGVTACGARLYNPHLDKNEQICALENQGGIDLTINFEPYSALIFRAKTK